MQSLIDDTNAEYVQYVDAVYAKAAQYHASVEELDHLLVQRQSTLNQAASMKYAKLMKYMKRTKCKIFLDQMNKKQWSDLLQEMGYEEEDIIDFDTIDVFKGQINSEEDSLVTQKKLKVLLEEYVQTHPESTLYDAIQAVARNCQLDENLDNYIEGISRSLAKTDKRSLKETKALFERANRDLGKMSLLESKLNLMKSKVSDLNSGTYDRISQSLLDFKKHIESNAPSIILVMNDYIKEQYETLAMLTLEGKDLTAFYKDLQRSIFLIHCCEDDPIQMKMIMKLLIEDIGPTGEEGIKLIQKLAKKQKTMFVDEWCDGRPEAQAWRQIIELSSFDQPYNHDVIRSYKEILPNIERFELFPGVRLIEILAEGSSRDEKATIWEIIKEYVEVNGTVIEQINHRDTLKEISQLYEMDELRVNAVYQKALSLELESESLSQLTEYDRDYLHNVDYAKAFNNLSMIDGHIKCLFANNKKLLALADRYIKSKKEELKSGSEDTNIREKFSGKKFHIMSVIMEMISDVEDKLKETRGEQNKAMAKVKEEIYELERSAIKKTPASAQFSCEKKQEIDNAEAELETMQEELGKKLKEKSIIDQSIQEITVQIEESKSYEVADSLTRENIIRRVAERGVMQINLEHEKQKSTELQKEVDSREAEITGQKSLIAKLSEQPNDVSLYSLIKETKEKLVKKRSELFELEKQNRSYERIVKITKLSGQMTQLLKERPNKVYKINLALSNVLQNHPAITFDRIVKKMDDPMLDKTSEFGKLKDALGEHRHFITKFINIFYKTETKSAKFFREQMTSGRICTDTQYVEPNQDEHNRNRMK